MEQKKNKKRRRHLYLPREKKETKESFPPRIHRGGGSGRTETSFLRSSWSFHQFSLLFIPSGSLSLMLGYCRICTANTNYERTKASPDQDKKKKTRQYYIAKPSRYHVCLRSTCERILRNKNCGGCSKGASTTTSCCCFCSPSFDEEND